MIDVLVAGAGPVGLVFAISAAAAGLEVRVLDPRTAPIDKACGEGLMPEAVAQLALLGVDPQGVDFAGIRYIAPGHSVVAHFAGGHGRGVRRTVLQAQLHARAVELGVQFAEDRVTHVVQFDDRIQAGDWSARHIVGADGLHSQVRAALGLSVSAGPGPRYGIRQHWAVAPWTDVVEVYWLPDAELYVTPVDEETVGIAVLGPAPLDLHSSIAKVPALAHRLRGAHAVSSIRGAGPMHAQVARRWAGRALLIGDAAGYVDALTGEGLRIGFAQARAAVDAIVSDDLASYEREWHRITRSYRLLTSSLLFCARRRPLRKALVPAAQAMPFAFRQIVNLL